MKPPVEVKAELDRIAKLNEPERTEALEAFNDLLLATATIELMSKCKSARLLPTTPTIKLIRVSRSHTARSPRANESLL